MLTVAVDDVSDPRLLAFTKLTDMQLRMRMEPQEGIFLAEGEKVILRALHAGFEPISAFMEEKWLPALKPELRRHACTVFLADEVVLKAVTGYRLHRGALAAFRRKPLPAVSQVLTSARFVVVLEDLVDHTNVGLIFRSAAGLGADAVLVSPQCADPLYRRSVKVSMGAVLTTPWTRAEPWPWVLEDLGERDFERVALTPSDDARDLRGWRASSTTGRVALLLGSEGPGLTKEAFHRVDTSLRIPMTERVDSLNVAAAAAIACYAVAAGNDRANLAK